MQCPKCGHEAEGRFCAMCGAPLSRVCPQCGTDVPVTYKFCPQCGTPLSDSPTSSNIPKIGGEVHFGDVGVFKGSIDASVHIGAYITGPVQVSVESPGKDPNALFQQALVAFRSGHYKESVSLLRELVTSGIDDGRIHLLLGIALLRGRNPNVLPQQTITEAESHLKIALNSRQSRAMAMVVLAVIKYDRYLVNGLSEGTPRLLELLRALKNLSENDIDMSIISHVNASKDIKKRLRMWW